MERPRRLRKPNPRTSQEMEAQLIPPPLSQSEPQSEPSQPRVRKPRGPNKGRDAKPQPSDRPELTIVSDREFDANPDCSQISSTIRLIICSNVRGPYTKFMEFPKDDREQCLAEFLERYRWAGGQDPDDCEKVFIRIACKMYTSAMTSARRACRTKHGNDYQKWKEMPPDWLDNQEDWNVMCDQWALPSWQQLSEQNAANRKAPGNLVNHVAGTRSAFRHAKKMKAATGMEPTYEDVFKKTHIKKHTGEFCDVKSKEVLENYAFYKANPEVPQEGDLEKWVRATGGVLHGRIYGVGGMIDVSKIIKNKRVRCETPPAPSPPPPSQQVYTQTEVNAMMLEERRHMMDYITTICNHIGLQIPSFDQGSSGSSAETMQEGQNPYIGNEQDD